MKSSKIKEFSINLIEEVVKSIFLALIFSILFPVIYKQLFSTQVEYKYINLNEENCNDYSISENNEISDYKAFKSNADKIDVKSEKFEGTHYLLCEYELTYKPKDISIEFGGALVKFPDGNSDGFTLLFFNQESIENSEFYNQETNEFMPKHKYAGVLKPTWKYFYKLSQKYFSPLSTGSLQPYHYTVRGNFDFSKRMIVGFAVRDAWDSNQDKDDVSLEIDPIVIKITKPAGWFELNFQ